MNQYPASNFHDLNLDWLLQQMKNCLAEWNETKTDWENLEADNTEFKAFVTNYLQNLDVTDEISAKIDALVADGTFLELLTEDTGEGSPLSDTVGAWLAAHITQETGYVIDDTLTVQGAAADAKAAGDAIADLKGATEKNKEMTQKAESLLEIGKTKISVDSIGNGFIKPDGTVGESSNWILVAVSSIDPGNTVDVSSWFAAINAGAQPKCQYAIYDTLVTSENYTQIDSSHVLEVGTPQVETPAQTLRTNNIFVPKNAVSVMFSASAGNAINVYLHMYPSIADTVNTVNSLMMDNGITVKTGMNWVDNYYINDGGTATSNSDFKYSEPIEAKTGEKIYWFSKGYLTNVAMISLCDSTGNNIEPVVVSVDSNSNIYSYEFLNDGYYIICTDKTETNAILLTKGDTPDIIDYSVFFPKMAVIGDSLSSGELYPTPQNEYVDKYGGSWLSFIARHNNAKRNHYSEGGLTAKNWLNTYSTRLQADDPADVYFIALGTNDEYRHPYDMGSSSDTAGTNSFAGYYKQIIETVQTKAPNAAIFCLSFYRYIEGWNDLIEAIAGQYTKTYYLDVASNSPIHTTMPNNLYVRGTHFTTIGYRIIANVILNQMNNIIADNQSDFRFYSYANMIQNQFDW